MSVSFFLVLNASNRQKPDHNIKHILQERNPFMTFKESTKNLYGIYVTLVRLGKDNNTGQRNSWNPESIKQVGHDKTYICGGVSRLSYIL